MAEPLSRHLDPAVLVFDCMDELSAFRDAPPELVARERALSARADLVFTGGPSLYEAKTDRHPRVHLFPSSVDVDHFARALEIHRAIGNRAGEAAAFNNMGNDFTNVEGPVWIGDSLYFSEYKTTNVPLAAAEAAVRVNPPAETTAVRTMYKRVGLDPTKTRPSQTSGVVAKPSSPPW